MSSRARTPPPSASDDPTARWDAIRAAWLRPPASPPSTASDDPARATAAAACRERDPVFQQRIGTLGELLREANAAATASSSSSAPPAALAPPGSSAAAALLVPGLQRADDGSGAGSSGSRLGAATAGKGKERAAAEEDDEDVPDGGMPIRDAGGQGDPVHELKKVSEGIFLAFKQGRALKEPLPLSLVTALLFRSWFLDGTIPPNYVAEPEPLASIPAHLQVEMSHPSATTSAAVSPLLRPAAPTRAPSILAALSAQSPNAVTPLPSSSSSSDPGAALPATPPPPSARTDVPATTLTAASPSKPGVHPLQAHAHDVAAAADSGTLKLDVLRGSRWRTEKEIASGSDVI
ncbi:Nucleolar GTP-binding protein 1 [Rhodotorula kratochvilovae]